jgi:hypothetical protein
MIHTNQGQRQARCGLVGRDKLPRAANSSPDGSVPTTLGGGMTAVIPVAIREGHHDPEQIAVAQAIMEFLGSI